MADGTSYRLYSCSSKDEYNLASKGEQVEVIYTGTSNLKAEPKRTGSIFPWKGNTPRSLSLQQTSTLRRPCMISHGETINIQFEAGDKLTIMFMYKNKYAVYRKTDGAIAVLSNAEFQATPSAMLDGAKHGALLNDVELFLMYAVAKQDHSDAECLKLNRNDVILILAHCKGTFVGITPRKKVGLFSSELVRPITRERLCMFKGMILKMLPVGDNVGTPYEITKSSEGLFSWFTVDGQIVALHGLTEVTSPEYGYMKPLPEPPTVSPVYCHRGYMTSLPQPPTVSPVYSDRTTMSSLYDEMWFHGNLSRTEAENLLENVGDFLVRHMRSHPWTYVLSCKTAHGYEHFKLTLNEYSQYQTHGGQFKSIRELIKYHQFNLAPISHDPATVICRPVKSVSSRPLHYRELETNTERKTYTAIPSPTESSSESSLKSPGPYPSVVISNTDTAYEYENMEEVFQHDQQETTSDKCDENNCVQKLITKFDSCGVSSEPDTSEESDKDSHIYEVPREEKSPIVRRRLLGKNDARKQWRRSRSPIGNVKSILQQFRVVEEQLTDIQPHFQDEANRREHLLKILQQFRQMEINIPMYWTVAEYLEPELFHDVGRRLGVHRIRRIQIEKNEDDIIRRTVDLLNQWHRKEGKEATLGKLVDVLDEFYPEDLVLILEELCEDVKDAVEDAQKEAGNLSEKK